MYQAQIQQVLTKEPEKINGHHYNNITKCYLQVFSEQSQASQLHLKPIDLALWETAPDV